MKQALWWKMNDNRGDLTWESEAKNYCQSNPWNNSTKKMQRGFSLYLQRSSKREHAEVEFG